MNFALLAGIVATSAVGSIHCVAMCGPLVGLHGGARSLHLAAMHSLGRLTTYALLGAAAGTLGGALDLAGRLGNVQRVATLLAGAFVLAWGVYLLVRKKSVAKQSGPSTFGNALVRIRTKPPRMRAWLMGTLTGLLPCGWLWAFVITAGGTGSALLGASVMAAFWLGTVPAMVGLLGFAGPVFARVRTRLPAITAIALIAVGLGTLAMRWHDAGRPQHCSLCHERST